MYAKNERAVRFYKRENFTVLSEQIEEATGEKEYSMTWQMGRKERGAEIKYVDGIESI